MTLLSPTRTLAILGGEPAFPASLHLGRPNIGDRQQFMEDANQMFYNRIFYRGAE